MADLLLVQMTIYGERSYLGHIFQAGPYAGFYKYQGHKMDIGRGGSGACSPGNSLMFLTYMCAF